MMAYAVQLRALTQGVVYQSRDQLTALIGQTDQFNATDRIAVYADGYFIRLSNAVAADYPALAHYMGADSFHGAAQAYVRSYPSRHWDLNLYPIGFAAFIYAWLDDPTARALADLESAIVDVFWKPDSVPLNPTDLATLSMEQLAFYVFKPRAALKLLRLDASAHQYLAAFRAGEAPRHIESAPEHLCVVRHHNEVQRLVLQNDEYVLLSLLCAGSPFGAALDQLSGRISEAELMPLMARWLKAGLFQAQSINP